MTEGNGAGDGIRTRDINLGKVALYQLSYSRWRLLHSLAHRSGCQINAIVMPKPQSWQLCFS